MITDDDKIFKIGYYEIRLANNNIATICIDNITGKSIVFTFETGGIINKISTRKFKFKNDDDVEFIKDFKSQKGFDAIILNHYTKNQIAKRTFSKLCNEIIIDRKQIPEDIENLICDFI